MQLSTGPRSVSQIAYRDALCGGIGKRIEPFIILVDDRQFHPLSPRRSEITIETIAYGCAGEPRFAGHTRPRYFVAEHCVRVSRLLAQWGYSPKVQLAGLLHDAAEGLGFRDLPSPVKRAPRMAGYRVAERNCQRVVYRKFGLPPWEPVAVKRADMVLLATERRDVKRATIWDRDLPAPLPGRIKPWSSRRAEREFLKRFRELGGRS